MARNHLITSTPLTPHVRTLLVYGGSLNNGGLRLRSVTIENKGKLL